MFQSINLVQAGVSVSERKEQEIYSEIRDLLKKFRSWSTFFKLFRRIYRKSKMLKLGSRYIYFPFRF